MDELYFLIVNFNSSSLVTRLVKSLDSEQDGYQLIVVNNSIEDKNIYRLESNRLIIIEAKENIGFGRACNLGLDWIYQRNKQAIVWLINPDAYFKLDDEAKISPIKSAIAFRKNQPQISILGTVVCNSEGEVTAAGGSFTAGTGSLKVIDYLTNKLEQDYLKPDWVSGCSLLINLANFSQCPKFDSRYFLYYEDLDFCLRYAQQGHQIALIPWLKVFHDTSAITNRNLKKKYQHITHSYLIHMEKYSSLPIFVLTNIRICLNTIRLIILQPQQGWGKLTGIYNYWQTRLTNSDIRS